MYGRTELPMKKKKSLSEATSRTVLGCLAKDPALLKKFFLEKTLGDRTRENEGNRVWEGAFFFSSLLYTIHLDIFGSMLRFCFFFYLRKPLSRVSFTLKIILYIRNDFQMSALEQISFHFIQNRRP